MGAVEYYESLLNKGLVTFNIKYEDEDDKEAQRDISEKLLPLNMKIDEVI